MDLHCLSALITLEIMTMTVRMTAPQGLYSNARVRQDSQGGLSALFTKADQFIICPNHPYLCYIINIRTLLDRKLSYIQ